MPGPIDSSQANRSKNPCALHAAGHCRFGERCRNRHVGDAGSEAAQKAYADFQKTKGQGGDKGGKGKDGKGKNKSDGKGKNKGDGKSKSDVKNSKGAAATTPAAVAAAASTVTITEAQGQCVQEAWKSFCAFCSKALPSLNVFLKLSVPILATLISSIVNSVEQIGEVHAASMIDPAIQDFRKLSLEFLGDTGAAHDIGSLRALEEQGIDRSVLEPWIRALDNPVRFATGGGPQVSTEALKLYSKELGQFNLHLLENCPMALSIGRQVAQGKTFVWQHGKSPYLAMDHRRCKVWCPLENRYYAKRVQNNVPIFAIEDKRQLKQLMCAHEEPANLWQPALCAHEEPTSSFCGNCMERFSACVCHLPDVNEPSEVANVAIERDHEPSLQVCVGSLGDKEHVRRKHRKDNRRRKWEARKLAKTTSLEPAVPSHEVIQGEHAAERIYEDLMDFYSSPGPDKSYDDLETFKSIAVRVKNEQDVFQKCPAQIAIPEQHHQGLKGHGMLIEYCTSDDSNVGKVGAQFGVHVVRCTEKTLNIEDPKTEKVLLDMAGNNPGVDLLGSLPCDPWTQWQNMNLHRYGQKYAEKLEESRNRSRRMMKRFCKIAREVARRGGRVTFEWPRYCSGWCMKELTALIRDLGMQLIDFDGCQVGLKNDQGVPFLKRWRLATTCSRTARLFSGLTCNHPKDFKHAVLEGRYTKASGYYTTLMAEYFINAMYPDFVVHHSPAMPVTTFAHEPEPHREQEPIEQPEPEPMIFESLDSMACPAEEELDAPADDEDDRPRISRDERLKAEATTLEHMTLHSSKNPFCEHCRRGRMLKRYAHRLRNEPEDEEVPYQRAEKFGDIIEADNIFPTVESRGLSGEQSALVVRDRYSGVSLVYPQMNRDEDSNYDSLKHFAGRTLSGKTDTVFCSDTAPELTKAATRLCWVPDPSAPNYWPHNTYVERDVRTIKELCRPSHIQAGFHRRLWTLSVDYTAKARSFFSDAPISRHEKGTDAEKLKAGKTRWELATGSRFEGPRYPLGALVFYRVKAEGIAEPSTKPGLFCGWHLSPGLRYRGNLMVLDYEAVRQRSHLHWNAKIVHEKEVFLPPTEHIEFPLAKAAQVAMSEMADEEKELKKEIYDRSKTEGVLPYDICIDSYPIESQPPPPRHAYITWARLLKHGFTAGCNGCAMGHNRHSPECKARFDAIFGTRSAPPTPAPIGSGAEPSGAIRDGSYSPSIASQLNMDDDIVPECPPRSDEEDEGNEDGEPVSSVSRSPSVFGPELPAAVTRQLPRDEVLSRQDALQAIRKEFQGIGSMGTWDLESVTEEHIVKKRSIEEGVTIHLADLLAICSEKHMELSEELRTLKGRVCYRGDNARTAEGKLAVYQTMAASPTSIVAANAIIAYGLMKGHRISSADAIKAYLQSWLDSLAETWVRLPREVWPQEWFHSDGTPKYRRPVIRLLKSLYGHPEAGFHWERHLAKELKSMGGIPIEEYPSTYVFPNYDNLALIVYVDDFVLSGPDGMHDKFWEDLGKKVLIDDIGDLGRFLGRHHTTIKHEEHERFAFDMRAYSKDIVQDFAQLTGATAFKKAASPFLAKVAEKLDGKDPEEPQGQLADSACSVLMKLMWLSRLARPDLLRATTWLATKIHSWTRSCDVHLHRVMSYLYHSQDDLLTGWIGDDMKDITLEMFVDADFCGGEEDCYSTSGGWIQLTGDNTQFPLAWTSKKQSTVARSTTEAETVALNFVLFEEGLPLLEMFKILFKCDTKLRIREDNEATAKVVTAGYSKRLRYLRRTQKISLASLAEELGKPDVSLVLVRSLGQKADIFTKAVSNGLWNNAVELLGIVSEYQVISSTQTGLKMKEEINLNEALGQSAPQTNKIGVRKAKKKKPIRVPLYSKPD